MQGSAAAGQAGHKRDEEENQGRRRASHGENEKDQRHKVWLVGNAAGPAQVAEKIGQKRIPGAGGVGSGPSRICQHRQRTENEEQNRIDSGGEKPAGLDSKIANHEDTKKTNKSNRGSTELAEVRLHIFRR